jgi:hypothetical protein
MEQFFVLLIAPTQSATFRATPNWGVSTIVAAVQKRFFDAPDFGACRAPGVCADKWAASEKRSKKGFVTTTMVRADLAIEPCGKSCLACAGADAPFKA